MNVNCRGHHIQRQSSIYIVCSIGVGCENQKINFMVLAKFTRWVFLFQVIPTKDRIEGLTAFREKRMPKYTGH